MKRRAFIGGLFLGPFCRETFAADPLSALQETPMFRERVNAGGLPPVARRIPEQPFVVRAFAGGDGPGRQGGQLTMLMVRTRDTIMMTVYSYTRLIGYDATFTLRPNILESYENKEDRAFTFRLRAGHRWSDGHPFTTEDFRFFWEDIANDRELSPSGPPSELLVDGRPPDVEVVDEHTIRYSWDRPNPYFVESQARAAPLFLFSPAHYLKKFHPRYSEAARTAGAAKGGQKYGSWVQTFRRLDTLLVNDNVDLPTLNPWVLTTPPPAERYVFVRNPYYHRIDEKGQQLPYADRVIFSVVSPGAIAAKAALGEADLQLRYLKMRDYTFLQNSARSSGVSVRLWELGSGSQLALYPNLTTNDTAWRGLMRDVRFRRALSLAVDRDELNQVVYVGLATPSNNTVMSRSPLFRPHYATRWAGHDPQAANQLLDEIGLTRRDADGIRLLPDGRAALIVVESQSEATEDADTLQLIADSWKKIGIRMLVKLQTLENFWRRTAAGEPVMTAYGGVFNAVPWPGTSPKEFAPVTGSGLQWLKWGMYVESKGAMGEKCDLPEARLLLDQVEAWERAPDEEGRRAAWQEILEINADQVFSIGTVNGIRQPILVGPKIRNVPKEGFYAWDPGGYVGLYQPDTFWVAP
ncbi:ABC transporter substrate-binding protein [soil metagenome]